MAGVRSGKTVTTIDTSTGEITGTTEYKYTTLSGKLVRVEYNTTILDIVYDESGQPFSIRYKSSPTATGALYYYVLNAQGDVIGLLNSSGELVVEYKYDPWGKLLETIIGVDETDSKYAAYNNMGLRNPLRYRGKYTVFIPLIISTIIEGCLFLQISKVALSSRAKKITKYIGIYLLFGSAIAVPLVLIKWFIGN